jgi:hypothetical protein
MKNGDMRPIRPNPPPVTLARERLALARTAFRQAARVAERGDPGSANRVTAALHEVNAAMAALRQLETAERLSA